MHNPQIGVVIVDSCCLSFLEDPSVLKRVRKDMRIADMQIRLSAINILEAVKTPISVIRDRLLKIIRGVSEGRPFLPWPLDLIKKSGQAIANGEISFWSGESGLEKKVYENSITNIDVISASERMDSLEDHFTIMHDEARKELQRLLRENNSSKLNTAKAFLDQIWSTKSHLEYHIRNIWETLCLPGSPPIETILEDEIWQIFFDINGFGAFERAVVKEQPKRVHYPDLLQLMYVANNPRRIVVSNDSGFLRGARTILLNRYPCVRVLGCSDL